MNVLSAALDAGLALSVVTIFFTYVVSPSPESRRLTSSSLRLDSLQYPKSGTIGLNTIQNWWGNRVFLTNYDGLGMPVRQLASGETFG
ncbi:hypothetical protein J3R83DRAFT_7239 [Lanmaoa asiatica]|nr:hypothetical protein J3R83DRAFT_7239 [Lanmaoa asiatica]